MVDSQQLSCIIPPLLNLNTFACTHIFLFFPRFLPWLPPSLSTLCPLVTSLILTHLTALHIYLATSWLHFKAAVMFFHLPTQRVHWDVLQRLKHVESKSSSSPPTLITSPSWFYCPSLGILGQNLGSPTHRRNLNPTSGMATTDLKGEWSSPSKEFQLLVYLKWLPNWDIEKIIFIFPISHIIRTHHLIGHFQEPAPLSSNPTLKGALPLLRSGVGKGKGCLHNS